MLKFSIFRFNYRNLSKVLCILVLLIPYAVFSFGEIYSISTPYYLNYNWLDYHFGIIHLLILLCGTFICLKNKNTITIFMVLLFIFREILIACFSDNNIFTLNSYEIYLSLMVGVALFFCVKETYNSKCGFESFYWKSIFFNILTIGISFTMNINKIEGRYNASNLDVGATGFIASLMLLMLFFNTSIKHRWIMSILCMIALVLSGSRTPFIVALILIAFGKNVLFAKNRPKRFFIISLLLPVFIITSLSFIYFLGYYDAIISSVKESRMLGVVISGELSADSSFTGRLDSLLAGFNILKENVFGVSGSFIVLQSLMVNNGYPTFPHSTLLSYYLLLGPIALYCYYILFGILRELIKYKVEDYSMLVLFLLIMTIVYGAPVVNFKIVFFYISLIYIARIKIKEIKGT